MRVRNAPTLADLEMLYTAQFARFVRTARAVTGDPDGAEDAVHEAFVACVRGRSRYRGDGPLEAWVWRAVITSSLKWRRRHLRDYRGTRRGEPPMLDDDTDTERVRAMIAAMPERQRLCLFLRYYADLDYRTIAAALEIQTGTVAATLNSAHARLRAALTEVPA
jgi:RNA polymerase sigma-70 factor (ECF subfamily)